MSLGLGIYGCLWNKSNPNPRNIPIHRHIGLPPYSSNVINMSTLLDLKQLPLRLGYASNHPTDYTLEKDLIALGYTVLSGNALNQALESPPHLLIWDLWDEGVEDFLTEHRDHSPHKQLPLVGIVSETLIDYFSKLTTLHPTTFLLRPVRLLQLQLTLHTMAHHLLEDATPNYPEPKSPLLEDAIFLREGTRFRRLPLHEIQYLEAERRYCKVVTPKKSYLHTLPLQSLLEQLPPHRFLRVHRSYAVQVDAITAISTRMLYVGNKGIPVGEQYKDVVRQQLFRFALKSG